MLCYVVCDASATVGCDRGRKEDKGGLSNALLKTKVTEIITI